MLNRKRESEMEEMEPCVSVVGDFFSSLSLLEWGGEFYGGFHP